MKRQFIDNDKNGNLTDGVEFFAVGLIVGDYTDNGLGNPSGKDYCVEFIDPWGQHHCAWRAVEEITISDIDDVDAEKLERAFLAANADCNESECTHDLIVTKMMGDDSVIKVCANCGEEF